MITSSEHIAAFQPPRRITRNHRLWEEYLLRYADLAVSHVDRSADAMEHSLSEDMIRELEEALRRHDRLPETGLSPSVHPIASLTGGAEKGGVD